MKNSRKMLIHLFLVMVFYIASLYATSPELKMPVEIKNIKIVSIVDNNIKIEVEYLTNIDESATISLYVTDNIELLDKGILITKNRLVQNLLLVKNKTDKKQFMINQRNKGTSLIHIHIEIPEAPTGYKKKVSRYFKIIREKDTYSIFDPRNPGDTKPKEIGKDVLIKQGESNSLKKDNSIQSTQNYTVSISGKVKIQVGDIGLYGNGVALWFRNTSNPDSWYHPVYSADNILHTHYDILDEQGNFNFYFSFTGDLSGYNQAIVIVNTANDATYMPAPEDGYIQWGPHGFTAYFNESEGVIAAINGSNSNITVNQDGVVNYEDGSVLRYLQLAREFVIQRYGGSLTFNLPHINSATEDISSAGVFNYGWDPSNGDWCNIRIDPYYTDFSTVSHEYGHFVNYRMWGGEYSKMSDAHPQLIEGWAIFYSFASRNYGNKTYGDYLMSYDDNTEEAPFQENPRYDCIRYTHHGHPDYGAAGSFFWSLYDSYNNGNFEVSSYNGDNDDISGYSNRVFEKLRTLSITHTSAYIDHFKNGLNSTVNNSIDDMVNFMFDDYYNIPSHKMRASQVKDFYAQINSNNTQINFSWIPQSYSGNEYYGNYETGYKIYKENGSSWQLIATLSEGTSSYTYNSSNVVKKYKITSYNSSGESTKQPVFTPLSVTISGPSVLIGHQFDKDTKAPQYHATGTWEADADGGTGNYDYQWYYYGYYGWTEYPGEIYSTMTKTLYYDPDGHDLKCVVIAGNEQEEDQIHVYVTGDEPFKKSSIPQTITLNTNYPNPFNPTTNIKFELSKSQKVEISVYSISGKKVRTLVNNTMEAGYHTINWDATDDSGTKVASGVYIYQMKCNGKIFTNKMILAK
ncbi:MAG: T9SS type A sorting domain-containing protein [Candidatus Marinimicrobia bacterium]|jgi:hypothetical protein|nr:T9SS type A sorting domain-containing protein [Candidatus Neomarinimicrobiota bacterium]